MNTILLILFSFLSVPAAEASFSSEAGACKAFVRQKIWAHDLDKFDSRKREVLEAKHTFVSKKGDELLFTYTFKIGSHEKFSTYKVRVTIIAKDNAITCKVTNIAEDK
jgi:hypothetical protein